MTLFFVLSGLLLAGALLPMKRRKLAAALAALTVLFFWAAGAGLLPHYFGNRLQLPYARLAAGESWGMNNIILLLGAGGVSAPQGQGGEPNLMGYSRITEALRVYRLCKSAGRSCVILISGGRTEGLSVSEAEIYAKLLQELGVDKSDIRLERNSLNTFSNARASSRIIADGGYDKVVLVTSGIHMRRSLLYLSHFGVVPRPSRADYMSARLSFLPVGYNLAMMDFILNEHVGFLRYAVYNFMGWNPPPSRRSEP